ncbi:sensor histidine kinase [Streptomyces sp. NBC_00887]|uniref:sensor histidine kinase n=1 Tax=Streptomyces sp. NBC_00887 TaxID=2975859 RepID=UPI0038647619|nr:sensor histidine kinase [Streptomyces sp. NBC_00887]
MDQRPEPEDELPVPSLHRWNAVLWVLLGVVPPAIAVADAPGTTRYPTLALLAVLALCYGAVGLFPGNPVLRPLPYLYVLVVGLGAMSYLLDGGAALFVVTLPHFWIYATSTRAAIAVSGLACAGVVAGNVVRQGWDGEFFTGNVVFTLIGYAAGVLVGLGLRRIAEDGDERARRLGAELEGARLRLAEAHQRQGAADERERLAREIHDTLAQGFASIVVLAEAARSGLGTDPGRSARQLLAIENTARENLTEARVLVGAAPQSGVANGSVADTLRRTLDRFTEDTGIGLASELPDVACDQQTRIALLRCTQESLANIRKHAAASTVEVVLTAQPYGVELEITDDGRGFVTEDSHGFGLNGMRKRLAELGGELTVTSSVGDGTRVLAMIPTNGQV